MVMEMFARNLGVKVIRVDAVDAFMGKLAGVSDPEQKRKIIGKEFVEVFQSESKKLSAAKWLAQGTIYPDVIESAGKGKKGAHTIKSHHNVGGLPEDMHLKLLEPLRELFKDQGRSPRTRRRARLAARDGLSPPLPRAGPRCAHSWRGNAEGGTSAAACRRHLHR